MHYCQPCNRKFPTRQSLDQHRETSLQHNCERCQKFFKSPNAKKKHIKTSPRHHQCGQCKRDFETEKALQRHYKNTHPVPTKQDGIMNTKSVLASNVEYMGIPPAAVKPVFALACRLRSSRPNPVTIIQHSRTKLDCAIVSSIIEGALRLPPLDNTPEGIQWRQEKQRMKSEQAQLAEMQFTNSIRNLDYEFQTEAEQRDSMTSPTPDIRFLDPVLISGHLCFWLEYKNYFGFRANPFIASQNKKQLKRYTTTIGPGGVVFKLGFEIGHLNIEGVKAFREEELLQCLKRNEVIG
ncbi:hypothetical protein FQN57_003453 [Myotisia sp. PD_48]|nr:hypothetical protein FQN57_003453 [Myotisia sp. PD_48]